MSWGVPGKTYRVNKRGFVVLSLFYVLFVVALLESPGGFVLLGPLVYVFGLLNYYLGGGK